MSSYWCTDFKPVIRILHLLRIICLLENSRQRFYWASLTKEEQVWAYRRKQEDWLLRFLTSCQAGCVKNSTKSHLLVTRWVVSSSEQQLNTSRDSGRTSTHTFLCRLPISDTWTTARRLWRLAYGISITGRNVIVSESWWWSTSRIRQNPSYFGWQVRIPWGNSRRLP